MTVRLLLAPCCHDTIDLDPPDTEYLMLKVRMKVDAPDGSGDPQPEPACEVEAEQPYHVACLKNGRGIKDGVHYEQISVPGPLGTRRLARRSELSEG